MAEKTHADGTSLSGVLQHITVKRNMTFQYSVKQQSVDIQCNYNPHRTDKCAKSNTASAGKSPDLPSIIVDGQHPDSNGESLRGIVSKGNIRKCTQDRIDGEVQLKVYSSKYSPSSGYSSSTSEAAAIVTA